MNYDTFLAANHSLFGASNEACMDLECLLEAQMLQPPSPPSPGPEELPLFSPLSPLDSLFSLPSPGRSTEAQQASKPQPPPPSLAPATAHPASHSHPQTQAQHSGAQCPPSCLQTQPQHSGAQHPEAQQSSQPQQSAGKAGRRPSARQRQARVTDSSESLTCASGVGEGAGTLGTQGQAPTSLLNNDSGPPQPPPPPPEAQRPKNKKKFRDEAARSRRKAARKRQSMQDMEESLIQKMEELKILQQENEELRYHQGILDSLVCTRSHQLGMMQPTTDTPPTGGVVVTSGRDLTTQALSKKSKAQGAEESRAEGWESRVPRYPASTTLHSHSLCLFAAKPGTHIDPSYCQQITPSLFLEVYKDHVFALSEHLRILDSAHHQQPLQPGDPPLPAAEKGVINEACCLAHLYKFSSIHQPDLVACQMARHLESRSEGVPEGNHWRLLLQQLELSQQQVSDLLSALQLYKKLMNNVVSERTRMQAALREHEAGLIHAHSHDSCCGPQMLSIPEAEELLGKLLRNLRQERSLGWMLQGFMISHVCTVLQTAKVFAYSYPFIPDARPILSTLRNDLEARNALPAKLSRKLSG